MVVYPLVLITTNKEEQGGRGAGGAGGAGEVGEDE